MGLLSFLKVANRSMAVGKQAAEVTRLLGNVYGLTGVDHNAIMMLTEIEYGISTPNQVAVRYLVGFVSEMDRANPRCRQVAENIVAAANRAKRHGVDLPDDLLADLAFVVKERFDVDWEDVVARRPNG